MGVVTSESDLNPISERLKKAFKELIGRSSTFIVETKDILRPTVWLRRRRSESIHVVVTLTRILPIRMSIVSRV